MESLDGLADAGLLPGTKDHTGPVLKEFSAIRKPIPRLAPVMTATLFSRPECIMDHLATFEFRKSILPLKGGLAANFGSGFKSAAKGAGTLLGSHPDGAALFFFDIASPLP